MCICRVRLLFLIWLHRPTLYTIYYPRIIPTVFWTGFVRLLQCLRSHETPLQPLSDPVSTLLLCPSQSGMKVQSGGPARPWFGPTRCRNKKRPSHGPAEKFGLVGWAGKSWMGRDGPGRADGPGRMGRAVPLCTRHITIRYWRLQFHIL